VLVVPIPPGAVGSYSEFPKHDGNEDIMGLTMKHRVFNQLIINGTISWEYDGMIGLVGPKR